VTLDNKELQERASNKAFAKITMLNFDIDKLKSDIKNEMYGGLDREQMNLLYTATLCEREVWNYIAKTIEINN
jgi:hypothetical protein